MGLLDKDFLISPSHAASLMALSEMLRQGDLSFRGDEEVDELAAKSLIIDVGQKIALQVAT